MSAGAPVVDRDVDKLAPKFRAAVEASLAACHQNGLDAIVWEAYRSNELQELYYRRGRPPTREFPKPVTNARSNLYSWHGYYLAVDVISQKERWFAPDPRIVRRMRGDARRMYRHQREQEAIAWFTKVADIFKAHGCDWGGDWTQKDYPHMQWGKLRPTPSDRARELIQTGGPSAVWRVVGAM